MKKILLLLSMVVCAVSCQKKVSPLDTRYDISVDDDKMTYDAAWLEVIPSNNDFYYYVGVVAASEFFKYANDEQFIAAKMEELKKDYENMGLEEYSFFDLECEKGVYWGHQIFLEPDTQYFAVVFTINDDLQAVNHLHKAVFTTKSKKTSDITFDLALNGTKFTITPSNNDSYFYDYITEEELEEEYLGSLTIFYYLTVLYYEEYGFMVGQCDTGKSDSDAADYYDLKEGDKLYVVAFGYDYGLTSEPVCWTAVYQGQGKEGIIEPYEEDFDFDL